MIESKNILINLISLACVNLQITIKLLRIKCRRADDTLYNFNYLIELDNIPSYETEYKNDAHTCY